MRLASASRSRTRAAFDAHFRRRSHRRAVSASLLQTSAAAPTEKLSCARMPARLVETMATARPCNPPTNGKTSSGGREDLPSSVVRPVVLAFKESPVPCACEPFTLSRCPSSRHCLSRSAAAPSKSPMATMMTQVPRAREALALREAAPAEPSLRLEVLRAALLVRERRGLVPAALAQEGRARLELGPVVLVPVASRAAARARVELGPSVVAVPAVTPAVARARVELGPVAAAPAVMRAAARAPVELDPEAQAPVARRAVAPA